MMVGMILYIPPPPPPPCFDGWTTIYLPFPPPPPLEQSAQPVVSIASHALKKKNSNPRNQSLEKASGLPIMLTPTNLKHPHTQSPHIHNTLDMRKGIPLLNICTQKHLSLNLKFILRKIHICPGNKFKGKWTEANCLTRKYDLCYFTSNPLFG